MPFEPECYVVRGTDSNGGPWMTRKFVADGHHQSIGDAKWAAEGDVARMNAFGASVVAVRQVMSADGMTWVDVDEKGSD